jgi:hypothetical protein
MAVMTPNIFRDVFSGSWSGRISRDKEFQREVIFNWPEMSGKFSSIGTEPGSVVPEGGGILDNTRQVAISGWRSDIRRWGHVWYNEFGGYGDLQWTSSEVIDNVTNLYGICHECKQENSDPVDSIALCELYDKDNFRLTLMSFRRGLLEIVARRIRTGEELNKLLKNQSEGVLGISELYNL